MSNIELSNNPDFMNHYVTALFLPHTDLGLLLTTDNKEGMSLRKTDRHQAVACISATGNRRVKAVPALRSDCTSI